MSKELLELYAFAGRKIIEKYESGADSVSLLLYIAGIDSVLRTDPYPGFDESVSAIERVPLILANKSIMNAMNEAIDKRVEQMIEDSQFDSDFKRGRN